MENKGKIIALSISLPLCAIIGSVVGWFLGSYYKPSEVIKGTYVEDNIAFDNFKAYLEKSGKTEDDITSIDFSSSEVLKELSIGDIAGYSIYKYSYLTENTSYIAYNKALTGSINDQTVITQFIKNGDLRSKESVCTSSSGLFNFGEKAFNFNSKNEDYTKNTTPYDSKYDYYRAKSDVTFDFDAKECYATYTKRNVWSREKLVEILSGVPESPIGYKLSVNTLNENSWTTKGFKGEEVVLDNTVKKVDGNYEFRLNLNEEAYEVLANVSSTTTRDQNELAAMSKPPEYNNCGVVLTTTKDLLPIGLKGYEDYIAFTKLANAQTLGYSSFDFNYEYTPISHVNENKINYFKAESLI